MSELTRAEALRALETMKTWPMEEALWMMKLPPNERDIVCLLAGELGAVPVDEDGSEDPRTASLT